MNFFRKVFGVKKEHVFDLKKPMTMGAGLYRLKPGITYKRYEEVKTTSFECLACGAVVHATKEQINSGLPKACRYCD